jgi:uncharacterized membrane protein
MKESCSSKMSVIIHRLTWHNITVAKIHISMNIKHNFSMCYSYMPYVNFKCVQQQNNMIIKASLSVLSLHLTQTMHSNIRHITNCHRKTHHNTFSRSQKTVSDQTIDFTICTQNKNHRYYNQQDRQCTHNITLWHFRVTIVAMVMQQWLPV